MPPQCELLASIDVYVKTSAAVRRYRRLLAQQPKQHNLLPSTDRSRLSCFSRDELLPRRSRSSHRNGLLYPLSRDGDGVMGALTEGSRSSSSTPAVAAAAAAGSIICLPSCRAVAAAIMPPALEYSSSLDPKSRHHLVDGQVADILCSISAAAAGAGESMSEIVVIAIASPCSSRCQQPSWLSSTSRRCRQRSLNRRRRVRCSLARDAEVDGRAEPLHSSHFPNTSPGVATRGRTGSAPPSTAAGESVARLGLGQRLGAGGG
jgi:hypothetical protein